MSFLSLRLLDDEKPGTALPEHESKSAQSGSDSGSALPAEIEQLRQKVAEKSRVVVKPAPLTASVDAFSLAERGGVPTFATFKFGYLPTRGLLYSSIGHELALFALFMLFTYGLPMLRPEKLIVRPNPDQPLVYLPEIGGGSEGEKSPGGEKSAPQGASAAPAHASKGFAYPGAQAILSDPPQATNPFQT